MLTFEDGDKMNINSAADNKTDSVTGSLLGCALGDSIGLPFEGISARRIKRLNPGPLRQGLVFGQGMISDDTEHSCIVAQSLIASAGDPDKFGRNMAWRLRWWFLTLPGGIGFGTLRSIFKLWIGFPYHKSGVNSAGNGPMMRSAIIGAFAADDEQSREALVRVSSRMTHSDPRAERAAQLVAKAASMAANHENIFPENANRYFEKWMTEDDELKILVEQASKSAAENESAEHFCKNQNMAKGVSGYCYSSLAVVLQIWLRRYDNFEDAITEAVGCGGDTDTVAAIIGGIVGAQVGKQSLPESWLNRLTDWPRSVSWMESLCLQLNSVKDSSTRQRPKYVFFPFAFLRNMVFILIVLTHGFRRLLPPY